MTSQPETSGAFPVSMEQFGLTEYETKVYLELSSRLEASASELSKATGVAYTKVYSVLSSLARKGLVEIMRGKPSAYRTVDPEKALAALKQNKIERVTKAYDDAISSLRAIRPLGPKTADGEHGASWNISGRRNVINKLIEELGKAHRNVKVVFPGISMVGKPILDELLAKHKLPLKLLVSQSDRKLVHGISRAEIEYSDAIKSRYAIFDDRYCLMMAVETPDYWTGVFETCGNCTRQAREHFDLAWKAAEDN